MITFLFIIIGLIIGAPQIISGIKKISEFSERSSEKTKVEEGRVSLRKGIITVVAFFLFALIQPYSLTRIDAGHKGIKVNLTGDERGVSKYEYKTGWVVYNKWIEQLLEFPTFQQHIEYDQQAIITKGGFSAEIKPSYNYSLKPEAIGDMFENLRLPIREVEEGWLKNAIVSSVNDVANKWEVDQIFNQREQFESSIIAECNKRLSKWFVVSQLRTNIVPPAALQEAIISKTKAIQQAQAEDQKALTAEAEARKKVAIARGDSAQKVIGAQAEALVIKLQQTQLTPMYIEYIKANAWDGHLPTTMLGSNSQSLVNLK